MSSAILTRRLAFLLAGLVAFVLVVLGALGSGPAGPAGAAGLPDRPVQQAVSPGLQPGDRTREIRPVEWVELLVHLREQGRPADLFRALGFLEEAHASIAQANDLYALAGDAAREAGDLERAVRFYRRALEFDTPVAEAIRLRLGDALASLGQPAAVEDVLQPLLAADMAPRFRKQALRALARAWHQAGDRERAAAFDRRILAEPALSSEHAEARFDLARLCLEMGRPAQAAAEIEQLLWSRRSGGPKIEALRLLRQIESSHPEAASPVGAAERLQRGQLLYEAGHFDESVEELDAAVRVARAGTVASEARYLLGRVEYRRERFERALERYRDAIRHEPQRHFQQRCLIQAARCLQILGRPEQALTLYAQVLRLDGRTEDAAWASYELAAQKDRAGSVEEAAPAYEALGRDRAHASVAGAALLQAIRIRSALHQSLAAIAAARRLIDSFPRGRHSPQAQLLLARELERIGQPDQARLAYQRCIDELPGTLEEKLARQRLRELDPQTPSPDPDGRARAVFGPPFLDFLLRVPWVPPFLHNLMAALPFSSPGLAPAPAFASLAERDAWLASSGSDPLSLARVRARIHMRLGQLSDAADELIAALPLAPASPDLLCGLIALSHALGRPHRALAYAERLAQSFPGRGRLDGLPGSMLSELYPWPYRDQFEALAGRLGVDPLLAVAVVRQESRFNPQARSLAAARGLMQIVPVTFEGLRQEIGRPELGLDDLQRPEVNLELGIAYLKDLGERFGGRPEVVLAAYNAGPANAERWLAQTRGGDQLDFLAAITFKETRDYVRFVLDNWWTYYSLYRGGQTPPRQMLAFETTAGTAP
jgi:peptidoglycan lytic transglycosylase